MFFDQRLRKKQSLMKKSKFNSCFKIARGLVEDFCSNTTVHGVRYFTEGRRHWVERVWWILAFVSSVYLCSEFIRVIWINWKENPIIVRFDNKVIPVKFVPFPAITICPMTKIRSDLFNFTKSWIAMTHGSAKSQNMSAEEMKRMKTAFQICDKEIINGKYFNSDEGHDEFTDSSIYQMINELVPTVDDMMSVCRWLNKRYDCKKYFKTIYTQEGVCYTFNSMNSDENYRDAVSSSLMTVTGNPKALNWSLEKGYKNESGKTHNSYPYRLFGSGIRAGLSIVLSELKGVFDYACNGPDQSYKIALHTPDEIPQMSRNFFHIPNRRHAIFTVNPIVIITKQNLLKYPLDQRLCYYSDERRLQFFKVYHQRNCEFECLTNFTLNSCNCVSFSMPRASGTKICGTSKLSCYNKAQDEYFYKSMFEECFCLPTCTSVTYDVEMSQTKTEYDNWLKATQTPYNGSKPMARLTITFKDLGTIPLIREELNNITDVLASCGGLLGLFTGVSLLSIFELIYFFTIRLGCSLRGRTNGKSRNKIIIPTIKTIKPNLVSFVGVNGNVSNFKSNFLY